MDIVMNLTHIDGLIDSDGGASRGKQETLHTQDDRLPHARVSWIAGTVETQEHE